MKFATFLRTPPAAAYEFYSHGCVRIVSVSKYIIISDQCIKVNVWSIAWCCIHSKIIPELVNGSSKNMLAHALLLLLVFEHDFIQIRFGIFEFFCFCFMSNKYFLMLSNFARYLFSVNTIFYWWETYRSSLPGVFCEKGVLGNFTKFIGKHLCQSLWFHSDKFLFFWFFFVFALWVTNIF